MQDAAAQAFAELASTLSEIESKYIGPDRGIDLTGDLPHQPRHPQVPGRPG